MPGLANAPSQRTGGARAGPKGPSPLRLDLFDPPPTTPTRLSHPDLFQGKGHDLGEVGYRLKCNKRNGARDPQDSPQEKVHVGVLSEFFRDGLRHSAQDFDGGLFIDTLRRRFAFKPGEKLGLWMWKRMHHPPYVIQKPEHLSAVLEEFALMFKANPVDWSTLYFLAEPVDGPVGPRTLPSAWELGTLSSSLVADDNSDSISDWVELSSASSSRSNSVCSGNTWHDETSNSLASSSSSPSPTTLAEAASREAYESANPEINPTKCNAGFENDEYNTPEDSLDAEEPVKGQALADLDTDAGKGDVLEGDLHAVLPAALPPTEEEWDECCKLLTLRPEDHKDPTRRSIRIPGTEIDATPRQLWTAFQMLTCRSKRRMCGGILADVPGTGKTHICIVLCLLRALIFHNVADVKREWASTQRTAHRHSRRDDTSTPGNMCKCGNAMGIECYANPKGITRRLADTLARGPALIMVPSGVVEDWKQALVDGKLSSTYYHPVLFHTNVPRELKAPADLKVQLKVSVVPVDEVKVYSAKFEPQVQDGRYSCRIGEQPQPRLAERSSTAKEPERFIFLTTFDAKRFQAEFQIPLALPTEPALPAMLRRGRKCIKKTVYGCPVGLQLVDEFHKVRHYSSAAASLARAHRHIRDDNFDFWSVTGTPFPSSLMDVQTTLDILHRPEWDTPDSRHHRYLRGPHDLAGLEVAYQAAVQADASQTAQDSFRTQAQSFFTRELVIRNVEDTLFFGKTITRIKMVTPDIYSIKTPEPFIADVQAVADRVKAELELIHPDVQKAARTPAGHAKLTPLQVVSTFPGAARLILEGELDFDPDRLRARMQSSVGFGDETRPDVARLPFLQRCLDKVTEQSPKLAFILELIGAMEADPERRPKQVVRESDARKPWFKPDDPTIKKMVILTPSLGEAVFLYLAIRKQRPSARPALFHHDLKASEKTEILADWASLKPPQILTPSSGNNNSGSSNSTTTTTANTTVMRGHRVLVAPFDVAGTGLNLQTANYQVLTGPLRFKSDEAQAFRRTNREGQQLRSLVHFVLVAEDSPHDRLVMARQAQRRIVSDPFAVRSDLEMEEAGGGAGDSEGGADTD